MKPGSMKPGSMKPGSMKPVSITRTPWVILALALFAAACAQAPVGWKKSGGTKEQWSRDHAACRLNARKEADNRFRQLGSEIGSPVYSTGRTLERKMAVLEAEKHERRLFESCLKALGYTKKKPPTRKD